MPDTAKNRDARLAARMMRMPDGAQIKVGGSVLRKDGTYESGAPKWVKVEPEPSKTAVKTSIRPKKRKTLMDVKLELQTEEYNRIQKKQKTLLASKARSEA